MTASKFDNMSGTSIDSRPSCGCFGSTRWPPRTMAPLLRGVRVEPLRWRRTSLVDCLIKVTAFGRSPTGDRPQREDEHHPHAHRASSRGRSYVLTSDTVRVFLEQAAKRCQPGNDRRSGLQRAANKLRDGHSIPQLRVREQLARKLAIWTCPAVWLIDVTQLGVA